VFVLGLCVPLWNRHQCHCEGSPDILSPNCDSSFSSISLTEDQTISFTPSPRFRRSAALSNHKERSFGLSFRTLSSSGNLLSILGPGPGQGTLIEIVNGILIYQANVARGRPGINMTTNVEDSDGQWHHILLSVSPTGALTLKVDQLLVGYEPELSAAHNFPGPDIRMAVLGKTKSDDTGNDFTNTVFK